MWLALRIALAEAYASADILLFPSAVETFGNVTLEAIAGGCPGVVESKCGGHLIENGRNGYCCPEGDYEAFYRAVKSSLWTRTYVRPWVNMPRVLGALNARKL